MKSYLLGLICIALMLVFSCETEPFHEKKTINKFYSNFVEFQNAVNLLDKDTLLHSAWGKVISTSELRGARKTLEKLHVDSVYVFSGGCNMNILQKQYDFYAIEAGEKRIHFTKNRCDSLNSKKGYSKRETNAIVIGLGDFWSLWY
jgi:hypothetical protein